MESCKLIFIEEIQYSRWILYPYPLVNIAEGYTIHALWRLFNFSGSARVRALSVCRWCIDACNYTTVQRLVMSSLRPGQDRCQPQRWLAISLLYYSRHALTANTKIQKCSRQTKLLAQWQYIIETDLHNSFYCNNRQCRNSHSSCKDWFGCHCLSNHYWSERLC